ncbi:hypothetical protein M422DRAFT_257031 [Sphaerobolus stellatus SS14]|uniref:Unplaced genomic scaffold SPHSTscaffold_71, whole genome shotgun sequence n=1 Tax=Sphaerobolus stellatus (strain SS14) TaxID=990650 RepID=A0A0C9UZ84_SPHS4|nr:hypothetical protein M422DRAFT_257031 [Sphaerobolus stellatus SS14]
MENVDGRKPTKLEMLTANSNIQAFISLASTAESKDTVPAYSVSAETSNAPLTIAFSDAPTSPFSKLELVASTANGKTDVTLHPTYEGTIFQTSSWISPQLVENRETEDPSGQGRHRSISQRSAGSVVDAKVWWGKAENKENWGKVEVATSLSQNIVTLQ